jgi:uncharacterized protein (TIGR03000 family)
MYSMVLMAALTAGSATPDCHRCGGCCGCYGGYGCGGCYGGCYGCFGGCWGGCYGGCYGGWGGCYGCWGGYSSWGCCGCMGGVGFGGGVSYPGTIDGGMYAPGNVAPGTTPAPQGEQLPSPSTKKKPEDKETRLWNPNKAKLVVELPANAKLFIDDMPMKAEAGVRSFNTPALQPGQAYYYMVRVETMKDGKPVSETRRVIVRAGQIARADFKDLEADAVRTAQAK